MRKLAIEHSAHSVHQLYAHLVFVTYWRMGAITAERKAALRRHFQEICAKKGAELIEFGSDAESDRKRGDDHVHLLVRYPPTISISTLVQHLKGESSFRITRDEDKAGGAARNIPEFRWSKSYFAKSVGHTSGTGTARYVRNQGQKRKVASAP